MAKQTGLGDNFYVAGYDIGTDTASLSKISGSVATLDVTDISESAYVRLGGLRDGGIDFTVFHDPAAGFEHDALSPLPTADALMTYFRAGAIGNPAASMVAKQINYDPTRGQDGSLSFAVSGQANAFGLEWGVQLTPDRRVDTTATAAGPANSWNSGGSLSFGAQAYFHLFAFTGTSVTLSIWDSADNITFAAVAGLTTTAMNAAHTWQRVAISNSATVRQYVAVASAGTFTSADFVVQITKNLTAGIVF